MGTKESISYKMISHGSWYKQRERERESNSQDTRGERKGNRQVKNKRRDVVGWRRDGRREGMSMCGRKRERSTSKSNTQTLLWKPKESKSLLHCSHCRQEVGGRGHGEKHSVEDIVPRFKYTWAARLQDSWWTQSHIKCCRCSFHSHVEGMWWTREDRRQMAVMLAHISCFSSATAASRVWPHQPALKKQKLGEDNSRLMFEDTTEEASSLS